MTQRGEAVSRRWQQASIRAARFMKGRAAGTDVLIEVGAQHPLDQGVRPGSEFRSRLDEAHSLFLKFSTEQTVELYIPGSRHSTMGVADDITLSTAGVQYLMDRGVPGTSLHGDDLNDYYMGADGVYCSADECFVAAQYFTDNPRFGTLLSVVCPFQLTRKTLHYIHFGVVPTFIPVIASPDFHDATSEATEAIPYVLITDASCQGETSSYAARVRTERSPE